LADTTRCALFGHASGVLVAPEAVEPDPVGEEPDEADADDAMAA
jgi:hypothetical protein